MKMFNHRRTVLATFIVAALGMTTAASAAETRPEEKIPIGRKVIRIEARPTKIVLKHPFDYSQLLLTGHLDSGDAVDITRMVQIQMPASLLKVSQTGIVRPTADGDGSLQLSFAGHSLSIPVTITGQKE